MAEVPLQKLSHIVSIYLENSLSNSKTCFGYPDISLLIKKINLSKKILKNYFKEK